MNVPSGKRRMGTLPGGFPGAVMPVGKGATGVILSRGEERRDLAVR